MRRVTCIMPTRDRQRYSRESTEMFQRQTPTDGWEYRMLILDSSQHPWPPAKLPPNVTYLHREELREWTIGAIRNEAIRLTDGEVIVHWDDDDWQQHRRIATQLKALAIDPLATVTGTSLELYVDRERQVYTSDVRGIWLHGNSLMYLRKEWEEHPFPALPIGEDVLWIDRVRPLHVRDTRDVNLVVGGLHHANASPKNGLMLMPGMCLTRSHFDA